MKLLLILIFTIYILIIFLLITISSIIYFTDLYVGSTESSKHQTKLQLAISLFLFPVFHTIYLTLLSIVFSKLSEINRIVSASAIAAFLFGIN